MGIGTLLFVIVALLVSGFMTTLVHTNEEKRLAFVVTLAAFAIAYLGGREGGAYEDY
jgi:hypothetical protein